MEGVNKALALAKDPNSKKLGVLFNGKSVGNGEYVSRRDAQPTPQLTLENPKGTYIAVCLDLDAPFPKLPFLAIILHWIQPGLQPSNSSETGSQQLSASGVPPVAEYGPPGPPPLSGPHRYLFILYEQLEGFDGKKFGQPEQGKAFPIMKRMRYDFDGFVRDAKLGEMVAANWFVSN